MIIDTAHRYPIAAMRLLFGFIISIFTESSKTLNMKAFKLIDLIVQTLLLVTFVVLAMLNWGTRDLLYGYFILGAGQVISCLIHLGVRFRQKKRSARNNYQRLLLLVLVISACCLIPDFLYFLLIPLFVSPLLALFYWWITLSETIAFFTGDTAPTGQSIS